MSSRSAGRGKSAGVGDDLDEGAMAGWESGLPSVFLWYSEGKQTRPLTERGRTMRETMKLEIRRSEIAQ